MRRIEVMDFEKSLEKYKCKACVLSVERFPDKTFGNIRVIAGNRAHAEEVLKTTGKEFVPDTPYEYSFPKDMNFEDYVYRSAVLNQQIHTYVNLYKLGLWLEIYMLPLESDEDNMGYCLYSYNVDTRPNTDTMSDLSPEISAKVLSTCIKLHSSEDFNETMREVIQDIREICDARRCCVLLMDDENQDCCVLNDSLRTGEAPPSGESSSKNFYYTARTWEETLAGSTCLLVKDESGLQVVKERNPMWYSSLMRAKILSLVLFPLKHNGKLVGYIWASNFDVKNAVKIKEVLELATFFIASEIANYQLVKRLETLSAMDLLTGTRNRNSMNNRVAEFNSPGKEKPASLGIVFADLNGLKQINDKKGHVAGDRLLKRAALALQQVFAEDEIYRAGGDEFMVISENTSKESIEEKISELRRIADKDEELSFAIGLCYDDGDINILKAMHAADEGMYQDKEAYYKKYPERKYR